MWMFLWIANGLALPKLPGNLDKFIVTPEQQNYVTYCQNTLDEIDRLEKEVGPISKENVKDYSSANLNLGYIVGACATMESKYGSDLQAKQIAAVNRLYEVFIQKHLLIDLYGNGGMFDPLSQNIFTPDVPLDENHFLCKPERMDVVQSFIERSWLTSELKTLETTVHGKTPLVNFENDLAAAYDNYFVIAKEKANKCLESKLDQVRPYTNAAPAAVQKEWEATIRQEVGNNTDVKIARIVYPYGEFKRFTESKRELLNDGSIRVTNQDYEVMDAFIYVENGKFVDGYIVSLYKDHIQNSEYARFYGFDANGQLRPAQRLLKSNF